MSKGTYKRTKEHKKRMSERLRGTNNPMYRKNTLTNLKEKCEELWNINNGITLCRKCHKLTNNYGRPKKK